MLLIRKSRTLRFGAMLSSAALVAALAACGGADEGEETANATGPEESASPDLSGDPVRTMTFAPVNTNSAAYENAWITAEVFEQWINARGGIGGRPLEVVLCDGQGTAAGVEACAREAIAEDVVAVVGSSSFYGGNFQSVLVPSGIPFWGQTGSFTPQEFNAPNAFPFSIGPYASAVSGVIAAVEDGCKKLAYFVPDLPAIVASLDVVDDIVEANDLDVEVTTTRLPLTAADYSVEVTRAVQGEPDCVLIRVPENVASVLMPAFFATGSQAAVYGSIGNLSRTAVQGYEEFDQVKEAKVWGFYAPLQSDPAADFREALDAFDGDLKGYEYNSVAGLGGWAAYVGFAEVASEIEGDITAESFTEEANSSVVEAGGMVAPLDFTSPLPGGIPPFDEIYNRTGVLSTLDGELLRFYDMQPYFDKLSG